MSVYNLTSPPGQPVTSRSAHPLTGAGLRRRIASLLPCRGVLELSSWGLYPRGIEFLFFQSNVWRPLFPKTIEHEALFTKALEHISFKRIEHLASFIKAFRDTERNT